MSSSSRPAAATPPGASHGHAATAHDGPSSGLVVGVLALAGISVSLMQTLVIPIVGQLPALLDSTASNTSWAITATLLAGAVVTPIAGRLGDMLGKRPVLLASLAMMVAGSVVCASADSLTPMIVGRGLQGFAAGVIPLGISLMRDVLPAEKLGPATALMSASLGVGGALGLPAAALIADNLDWHWLFRVAAGLGAVVLLLIATLVRTPRSTSRATTGAGTGAGTTGTATTGTTPKARFDVLGAIGLSTTLVLLLLAVSKGEDWGWGSATTTTMLAAAVVLAFAWGAWELRTPQPLVDLRTAARRQVLLTNLASLVFGFAMFAMSLVLPQVIQLPAATGYGLGESMLVAGLAMVPGGLVMMITAGASAKVTRAHGPKTSLMTGAVIVAAGYGLGAIFMDAVWQLSVVSGVIGAGIGFAYGAMPALIMSAVPASSTAAANSFNTLVRSVGSSVSSAVAGAVLASSATTLGTVTVPSQSGFRTVLVVASGAALVALIVASFLPARARAAAVAPPSGAPAPRIEGQHAPSTSSTDRAGSSIPSAATTQAATTQAATTQAATTQAAVPTRERSGTADSALTVHGTVLSGGSSPLPGAVLTLTDPAGRQIAHGTSDAEGRYALPVPTGGTYLLITAAPHLSPHATLVAVGGRSLAHDVRLAGRSTLTGRVVTPGAAVLTGALVTLTDATGHVVASTSTDASGTYAFSTLPGGSYVVTAQSGQHPPAARGIDLDDDTARTLDLPLLGAATLTGTITAGSTGQPLAEAVVTLVDAGGDVVQRTTTDSDGGYELTDLPPGQHTLTASGYAPASRTVSVHAGTTASADLHLSSGSTIAVPAGRQ